MPRVVGWPSTIYPRQSVAGADEKEPPIPTILLQMPPVSQDLVAAGATVTYKTSIAGIVVIAIYVCLPEGVTGYLSFDGTRMIQSRDGLGLVGGLATGDLVNRAGLVRDQVEVSVTNANSSARDARFWVVAIPV